MLSSIDSRPPLAYDLFSGSGSALEAFREAGWQVVTVDTERWGRPSIQADVRQLPLHKKPDFLWASPPCTEYSTANPRRQAIERPNYELWWATLRIIRELEPRWWVIENVRGAARWWGLPAFHYGPFYLWTNLSEIRMRATDRPPRKTDHRSPRLRARIPPELSEAVLVAVARSGRVR
jgi:site-specific DNA-cytosine methylase